MWWNVSFLPEGTSRGLHTSEWITFNTLVDLWVVCELNEFLGFVPIKQTSHTFFRIINFCTPNINSFSTNWIRLSNLNDQTYSARANYHHSLQLLTSNFAAFISAWKVIFFAREVLSTDLWFLWNSFKELSFIVTE